MIKTLAAQIKEFKKESVLTPIFMVLEVVFETLIPLMMASIIDDGVEAGNMREFDLTLGELTDEERQIILKGCLINYNRV